MERRVIGAEEGRVILESLWPYYSLKTSTRELVLQSFQNFVDNEELIHPFLILMNDCSFSFLKTKDKGKNLSSREERKLKEKNLIKVARLLSIFSFRKNISLEQKKEIIFRLRVEIECSPLKKHPLLKDWGRV